MAPGTRQASYPDVAGALDAELADQFGSFAGRAIRAASSTAVPPQSSRRGTLPEHRRRHGAGVAGGTPQPLTREDILSVRAAADLLGMSPRTVYRLIDRCELPGARRLGRTVVVVRPVLEAWLLSSLDDRRK